MGEIVVRGEGEEAGFRKQLVADPSSHMDVLHLCVFSSDGNRESNMGSKFCCEAILHKWVGPEGHDLLGLDLRGKEDERKTSIDLLPHGDDLHSAEPPHTPPEGPAVVRSLENDIASQHSDFSLTSVGNMLAMK